MQTRKPVPFDETSMKLALMADEYNGLRDELRHLKLCQVHCFKSAVSSTGFILGIAGGVAVAIGFDPLISLAPLVVVLPCSVIFFDKATTITRIVGYQRVFEGMRLDPVSQTYTYIGWETSLGKFRARQDWGRETEKPGRFRHVLRYLTSAAKGALLLRSSSHRYWAVNWLTFTGLSVVCSSVALSAIQTRMAWMPLTAVALAAFVAVHNLHVYQTLCRGRSSYDANERMWQDLLASTPEHPYR